MRHFRIFLALLILSCTSATKTLPILSYTIDNNGQKKYYKITYSGFTNQLNQEFSTENLEEKVCVANFFFTRCPSICPPMRSALIDIAETFNKNENLLIISHTIDPEYDTVPILNTYAETTEISSERWQFIRASEKVTRAQAKQYMTNFNPNSDGSDFYHSSYVALIDKDQQIRGFYNILLEQEVLSLKNAIRTLLD